MELIGDQTEDALAVALGGMAAVAVKAWGLWAVVIAPSLYASEVVNALWKYVQAGTLGVEAALDRYAEAINLIDDFTPDLQLTTEALAEAVRYRHPVYAVRGTT